ncbi:MAG: hypothetical protein ABEN55_01090, partial [Bradymonadaceae bacterium]
SNEVFSGEATTTSKPVPGQVAESTGLDADSGQIGRSVDGADEDFYADGEDTAFDGSLHPSIEDSDASLHQDSAPATE